MINLLPPDIKVQMRYGRYNVRLVSFLWMLGGLVIILAAAFAGTLYYLGNQRHQLELTLAAQQSQIANYSSFESSAKSASDRLAAIKSILGGQTRFSLLLDDLAKVVPKGVAINGINLTGDASKPIRISIAATSYEAALAFRDAVIHSPRISGADLESVSKQDQTGIQSYTAQISIAFKPGAAK